MKINFDKKIFFWGIVGLLILRFVLVFLFMNNFPWTDMQSNGFRPSFGGSYWPDEINYFNLAKSLADFSPIPNVANLGYSLFLAPIVYLTHAVNPIDIAKIVFIVQAFFFYGLAIILTALISFEIFKKRSFAFISAFLFTIYPYIFLTVLKIAGFPRIIPAFHYQMWINIGADYLGAVLLYLGFYLFIKRYNLNQFNIIPISLIGIIIAAAALTRVANILYIPIIFLILLWLGKNKESIAFGLSAFLVYLPQWIYNAYFFGSPITYGYRIKDLSGHGLETKIIGGWFSWNNVIIFFSKTWQNLPVFVLVLPVLILILAFGFYKLFKREKKLAIILAFWAMLNIGFYIFFVDAQSQLRYFIPSIPPLVVLFIGAFYKLEETQNEVN